MKKIHNFLQFLALSLICTSCSFLGLKRSVDAESLSKIKNVAVTSVLDSKMHHTSTGLTIFQNDEALVDVSAWKINDWAMDQMNLILKSKGKFNKVKTFNADFSSNEKFKKFIKQAKLQGFDTVIVLSPSGYDNAPNIKPGYGLYRGSSQKVVGKFAYLLAVINVFDTTSEKQIAWQWAFDSWNLNPGIIDETEIPWQDNFKDYKDEEKESIKKALKHKVFVSVDYGLKKLNLIP